MEKKIIFFDGDGTLWYPKKTKYKEGPWWIYALPGGVRVHNKHLILTPTTLQTLKQLRRLRILTVVLSTHPHPPKVADVLIHQRIRHLKLHGLFDEIHATREYHGAKGEFIEKILKKRKIPKCKALMVGDHYNWDYKPARAVGVDALLLESDYMKTHPIAKRVKHKIKKLSDLLKYLY